MKAPTNTNSRPRLRLRVTATAETILRSGHPWLFADSVREQNRPGETGELAVVFDRKDAFLAVGLYDAESPIRVRILHSGKPCNLDATWWKAHLQAAVEKRTGLFDAQTNGYRVLNGESDGWPGLVVDRYADVLVMKLYTAAWLPRLEEVIQLLESTVPHQHLVLRLSRNIQSVAAAKFRLTDGQIIRGTALENPVIFLESGLRFEADVIKGQKTGFFLDQRENRRHVETLATDRHVLNAFSFSGGFSLYATRGGAKSVTDLDISAHALESARRNWTLNRELPEFQKCTHEQVQADTFEWLEKPAGKKYDLIILDPPSLAKRELERAGAIQAYSRLTALGLKWLNRGGILLSASCSAHVSSEEFFGAVRSAAKISGRPFKELCTSLHAPDHHASFAEAQYLKAIYLQF